MSNNFYPLVPQPRAINELGDIADVNVPSPSDGQVIAWNVTNNEYEAVDVDNVAVFGAGRAYVRDDTIRTTTSKGVWTTQATLVTPNLDAGTYRLAWRLAHSQDVSSKSMDVRIRENGSDLETLTISSADNDIDSYEVNMAFIHLTGVAAGVKTITLEFKASNVSGSFEVSMKNTRLEWWRVA